jgi:hypothetical protein
MERILVEMNRQEETIPGHPARPTMGPAHVMTGQPRIRERLKSRLRHHIFLNKTVSKLEFLLSRYRFATLIELLRAESDRPSELVKNNDPR